MALRSEIDGWIDWMAAETLDAWQAAHLLAPVLVDLGLENSSAGSRLMA
jgi:hypothetical protein